MLIKQGNIYAYAQHIPCTIKRRRDNQGELRFGIISAARELGMGHVSQPDWMVSSIMDYFLISELGPLAHVVRVEIR